MEKSVERDVTSLEKGWFSSSSVSTHMLCPKKFYWTYVRGLEKREVKPTLEFGKAFHEVLLEWYKTGSQEKAIKKLEILPSMISEDHRTRGWGESIFKEYVKRYEKESDKTMHLEVRFRIEVGELLYIGIIDRIADWNGQVYVVDHKTTARLGLSFFEAYRPNPQIDGYCFACREIVGKCAGAIINGISVAANPKERFQRYISSRSDDEISMFEEVFMDEVDDIYRNEERKKWPMRTTECNHYGKCPFWEICVYHQRDEEMREKFIETNFKKRGEEVQNESTN
jgi:hypothetical protein